MPTADDQIVTQVAASLSDATGQKIDPSQVMPISQQHPLDKNLQDLLEDPKPEKDWDDIVAGEKGRPRNEPSKNFLKMFLQRLRKQHPQEEIGEKK